jgi:hypothetical protein
MGIYIFLFAFYGTVLFPQRDFHQLIYTQTIIIARFDKIADRTKILAIMFRLHQPK